MRPSEDLYFGFDQARFTPAETRQLEVLLEALSDNELRSLVFLINGHTCSIGRREYNQKLSERRANAVRKWLVDHDIFPDRLIAKGHGEDAPIGDNSTPGGGGKIAGLKLKLSASF